MQMHRSMTVLQVKDVVQSAAFYEKLGFTSGGFWGDPPDFCIVYRDGVSIALDKAEDGSVPTNQWWAVYIYVDDVDKVHTAFQKAGVSPADINRDAPYGCSDFDVVDPDGHRLAFGQDLSPGASPGL